MHWDRCCELELQVAVHCSPFHHCSGVCSSCRGRERDGLVSFCCLFSFSPWTAVSPSIEGFLSAPCCVLSLTVHFSCLLHQVFHVPMVLRVVGNSQGRLIIDPEH